MSITSQSLSLSTGWRHVPKELVQPAKQVACLSITHGRDRAAWPSASVAVNPDYVCRRGGLTRWRENHAVHADGALRLHGKDFPLH